MYADGQSPKAHVHDISDGAVIARHQVNNFCVFGDRSDWLCS